MYSQQRTVMEPNKIKRFYYFFFRTFYSFLARNNLMIKSFLFHFTDRFTVNKTKAYLLFLNKDIYFPFY